MSSSTKDPSIREILGAFLTNYSSSTPKKLKLIDVFLLFCGLQALVQVAYVAAVGTTFPFNSFLSGFFAALGAFFFTVSLRIQVSAEYEQTLGKADGKSDSSVASPSAERASADWFVGLLVLFLCVWNFMG
eukprot:ANDGO_01264.mRNA.1 Dolichyl-diphosphooligosaccharide--protein glycosyltransferase subunit DAD1